MNCMPHGVHDVLVMHVMVTSFANGSNECHSKTFSSVVCVVLLLRDFRRRKTLDGVDEEPVVVVLLLPALPFFFRGLLRRMDDKSIVCTICVCDDVDPSRATRMSNCPLKQQ